MAQTGNGATFIVTGSTGWVPAILSIGAFNRTRERLEDTVLSTTGGKKTYQPDDLSDFDEVSIEYFYDPSAAAFAPITAVANTGTITLPLITGDATAGTVAGTGFLTGDGHPELVNGSLMRATATWTWDGKTGPTFTAGAT